MTKFRKFNSTPAPMVQKSGMKNLEKKFVTKTGKKKQKLAKKKVGKVKKKKKLAKNWQKKIMSKKKVGK